MNDGPNSCRLGSEPAAPSVEFRRTDDDRAHLGLTKREYFAGLAMQGMSGSVMGELNEEHLMLFVQCCVRMADALLVELAKPEDGA